MAANFSWTDRNLPQQPVTLPVTMGPMAMAMPVQKPKRNWRRLIAWSLCVFGAGVAAGPPLIDYAARCIEDSVAWLTINAPGFLRPYLPKSPDQAGSRTRRAAVPVAQPAAPPARPEPAPAPPARSGAAPSEPTEVAQAPAVAPEIKPLPPEPTATPQAEPHAAAPKHAKPALASAAASLAARPAAHRPDKRVDPFDGAEGKPAEPAAKRVARGASEPTPARNEAHDEAPPKPAKSGDALDDLMAGVVGDSSSKPKGKRGTSKDIDAMLKDVQKSDPPPPPKRAEPAEPPALTASDIAKTMAGVKVGANACGKRTGQTGTAELKLTVGKDGKVSDVALRGKFLGSPIAECIQKVVRAAAFPPNAGLKFDYRVDVH